MRYRFISAVLPVAEDGTVEFDWPHDGGAGLASVRRVPAPAGFDAISALEVVWYEAVDE